MNKNLFKKASKISRSQVKKTAKSLQKADNECILADNVNTTNAGGVKYDGDKLRMNLVNLNYFDDMVKVLMFGANKYPDKNNYMKVDNAVERYFEAMLRHLKAMQGIGGIINLNSIDDETGLPHLSHLQCCSYFLEHFRREELK